MEELKNEMIKEAMIYNNCLTMDYLKQFSIVNLLSWIHPLDRRLYERKVESLLLLS